MLIPIVAIASTAWVIVMAFQTWGRKPAGGTVDRSEIEENVRLARENEELRRSIDRLEERLRVLERIATDPAERTAREIENLR